MILLLVYTAKTLNFVAQNWYVHKSNPQDWGSVNFPDGVCEAIACDLQLMQHMSNVLEGVLFTIYWVIFWLFRTFYFKPFENTCRISCKKD